MTQVDSIMQEAMKTDFIRNAEFGLRNLIDLGKQGAFAPGGHNGPYFHVETPVRNSSHWMISFLIAHQLTGRQAFVDGAIKLMTWLADNPYFSRDQYMHRRGGTDTCNGVIGDAWVIEALAYARQHSSVDELYSKASVILDLMIERQRHNSKTRAYWRFDRERGYLSEDYTFNHQLWLSMAMLQSDARREEALANINYYLEEAMQVRADGLIHHVYRTSSAKNHLNRVRYALTEKRSSKTVNLKERGYHLFNLYAFARIDILMSKDVVKHHPKIEKAVAYITSAFIEKLYAEKNKYAFNYNSPGYELPLICRHFNHPDASDLIAQGYEFHKLFSWNEDLGAFVNGVSDPMTHAARAYELGFHLLENRIV